MANPFVKSRIVFKRSGTTLYDLTNEALEFDIKTNLNSVDTFNFSLPTLKGAVTRPYLDLLLYDDVFLYIGQTSIPGSPLLAGKVVKITGQAQDTVQRTFFCKDLSEIAERRFKTKYYGSVSIHNIVAELAGDLGWGTGSIGTEGNTATENFDGVSYLELFNRLSDYWVSGATMVQKDWKVDAGSNLVWGNRPLRSSGVEVLVANNNLMKPVVHYDIETVKNAVKVFGNRTRTEPDGITTSDAWTESLTGWSLSQGYQMTLDNSAGNVQKGTYSVKGITQTLSNPLLELDFAPPSAPTPATVYCGERKDGFNNLHFKIKTFNQISQWTLELQTYAGQWLLAGSGLPNWVNGSWLEVNCPVGPNYNTAYTQELGTINDWNTAVVQLMFKAAFYGNGTIGMNIDDFYFSGGRFKSPETTDATSISSYGRRESVTVDDKLLSDAECLNRQTSLLYQFKNPIPLVTCPVPLNLNLLTGDRLTLTIPHENITGQIFDLIGVRHVISQANAQTIIDGVGTAASRLKPAMTAMDAIRQRFNRQDLLNRGVQQR